MSEFKDLLNIIKRDNEDTVTASSSSSGEVNNPDGNQFTKPEQCVQYNNNSNIIDSKQSNVPPFNIDLFVKEVWHKSETKGRAYSKLTQNINGYDIAHN